MVTLVRRVALKYRPKTFQEVIGQEYPKRVISQLILNNQSCANLLLHGSVGSGKTTLVRIYAGALNCEKPTALGDRCFSCDRCKALDEGDRSGFVELDTPKFRDFKTLKGEFDRIIDIAISTKRRTVVFLDEAHVLSKYRDSFDYFLKTVEEPPPNVAFCFATTALERISDALRSRAMLLEVRPLSETQSVDLLSRASVEEGLVFHPEAISLLAGLGENQPRNMLQALDMMGLVSNGVEITRDRVATVFGVDYIEHLVRYFESVGSGRFDLQTTKFLEWQDAVSRIVRLIQLFLIGLYYTELCGLAVSVAPVIGSIRKEERQRVIGAFARRLPGLDLRAFFEDLLNVWPVVTADLSDEALLAIVLRFQVVANKGEIAPRALAAMERIAPEPVPVKGPSDRTVRSKEARQGDADAPNDPAYLNRGHVRSIFAASSFLVQAGHQPFNARITIRHRIFGYEAQPDASTHFGKFSQALKGRLEHWGGTGLRIFVQERSEQEGSCGRVITHIPDPAVAASWFSAWHKAIRVGGAEDEAVTFEMVPAGERLEGHWSCVRWLCGGFNPADPIFTKLSIEPKFQRVAGDIGKRNRLDSSEPLGAAARLAEERNSGGLSLMSAFDDGCFERLYDGWELDESGFRKEERLRWKQAVAELEQRYFLYGSKEAKEVRDYELEELRRNWSTPKRHWRTWGAE